MQLILENVALIGDELAFSFNDDAEIYLPLPLLRRACPCAACQGEPDALGRVLKQRLEHGPQAYELLKYEAVGGYAVQLFWKDGHSSGIYGYQYLSNLSEV